MRFKIQEDALIFNQNKEKIEQMKSKTFGIFIISLPGLWIMDNKVWFHWTILQSQIYVPIQLKKYMFLDALKDSVTEALSDVVKLSSKLSNSKKNLPEKLPDNPMELSFWIGSHLGGPVAQEQQRLLEERNTYTRLKREFEMLDHTRKQLAARTALKESFPDIKEN